MSPRSMPVHLLDDRVYLLLGQVLVEEGEEILLFLLEVDGQEKLQPDGAFPERGAGRRRYGPFCRRDPLGETAVGGDLLFQVDMLPAHRRRRAAVLADQFVRLRVEPSLLSFRVGSEVVPQELDIPRQGFPDGRSRPAGERIGPPDDRLEALYDSLVVVPDPFRLPGHRTSFQNRILRTTFSLVSVQES